MSSYEYIMIIHVRVKQLYDQSEVPEVETFH